MSRTHTIAASLLGALLWFGWPTPYRALPLPPGSKAAGVLALRVHRVTGRVSVLTPTRGWQTLRTPFERAQARALPDQ